MELAEPPVLGEPATADFGSVMTYLPMGLGAGAMVLMYSVGSGGTSMYMMTGMMGVAMISMTLTQVGRPGADRRRRMRAERRDYLRYLAQKRVQARQAADGQRAALLWDNPDPSDLWALAAGPRLWERRPGHEDFGRIRIGLATRRAALEFLPPQTKPVEDLEPLCAISLRRFTKAHQTVPLLPVPVSLQRFTSVEFTGEAEEAVALARAMLGQLAVLHSRTNCGWRSSATRRHTTTGTGSSGCRTTPTRRRRTRPERCGWPRAITTNSSICSGPMSATVPTTTSPPRPASPSPSRSSSPRAYNFPPPQGCWAPGYAGWCCSTSPAR